MSKVLIAGMVAAAFSIVTIILFIAKTKWRSLDIPAIIGAIGTVAAIVVTILVIPDSTTPTPSGAVTPEGQAAE